MSNLARKLQQPQSQVYQPGPSVKKKPKVFSVTKGEKLFYILFTLGVCFLSVNIIANQANLYEMNKEIQVIQAEVSNQEKITEDLQAQIDELTDYRRLLEEAKKLGLSMDPNNVKSVFMP